MEIIERNIEKIRELCRKHKVATLYAFGSVTSDKFRDDSDIDLLVEFGEVDLYDFADNYFDFIDSLEKITKRKIDLLTQNSLSNPYLIQSIEQNKRLIYDN
jgi:predicted nucleotidyltransferase